MTDATNATILAIDRTLELNAPPERVWRAITDPVELTRWFPQQAEWELRPGGRGVFTWDGYGDFPVRVDAVDELRYLAYRWASDAGVDPDESDDHTLIEWWLEARPDGGTTLRVRESGFLTPERRAENDEGWTKELAELEALLAAG